jgi:hypothetical protein
MRPSSGLALATACLIYGLVVKTPEVRQLALLITVVAGLSAIGAFLTGEPAEDVVESLPGVTKALIHEHEAAADYALWTCQITALTALAALIVPRLRPQSRLAAKLFAATLLLALFTDTVLARTAWLGGQIRHTEIRDAVPPAS